ncbi:MAG: RsmD family RNA methyltransferase [Vampirovibrionales bacterium]
MSMKPLQKRCFSDKCDPVKPKTTKDWTQEVRPSTGKTIQAVWNILRHRMPEGYDTWEAFASEVSFLDLFAGLGHITQSAVQAGCGRVYALEKHPKRCPLIRQYASKHLTSSQTLDVFQADVLQAVQHACPHSGGFSLIYIDPPYDLPQHAGLSIFWVESLLKPLLGLTMADGSHGWFSPVVSSQNWGYIVLECRASELETLQTLLAHALPTLCMGNNKVGIDFTRVYGQAGLIFLSKNDKVSS